LLQFKAFSKQRYGYRKWEITPSWNKTPIRPEGKPAILAGCFVVNTRNAPALLAYHWAN